MTKKTRRLVAVMIATMGLSACLGGSTGGRDAATAPAVSHDAFVASLNGAYLWNCTMTNDAGEAWQFVLAKGRDSRWTPVVLRQVGARFDEDIEVARRGAARIYRLRDTSEVLIADDGEARGTGPQATLPKDFPQGQCTRGTQPDIYGLTF